MSLYQARNAAGFGALAGVSQGTVGELYRAKTDLAFWFLFEPSGASEPTQPPATNTESTLLSLVLVLVRPENYSPVRGRTLSMRSLYARNTPG